MRLLLDTNVILDVLGKRKPWVNESAAVLSLIETGNAEGFVAAHTITTIHYLLAKHLGREKAAAALLDVLNLLRVVPVDHETILKALSLGWTDFEDAVQAVCALQIAADHLVTRDPKPFQVISLSSVTPGELLALLAQQQEDSSAKS